jgi:hypothetical protein
MVVRHLSLGSFLVACAGFFLPFMTASCPGFEVQLTGLEVAFGKDLAPLGADGGGEAKSLDPNPSIAAAMAGAGLGVAASLAVGPGPRLLGVALGAAGTALLLVFRTRAAREAAAEGEGVISLRFEAGYWIALLGFVAAVAFGALELGTRRRVRRTVAANGAEP